MQTLSLFNTDCIAGYGLSQALELAVRIPLRVVHAEVDFVDAAGERLDGFESIHHRNETLVGLGDLALELRYRALQQSASQPLRIDLKAGVSVPTGSIEPDPFALGRQGRVHQHIFFGTGTFDPRLSVQLNYRLQSVRLSADTLWMGSLYRNRYDYRGPMTITQRALIASRLGAADWLFRIGMELFKEYPAEWRDEQAENSGRMDLSPLFGVQYTLGPNLMTFVSIKKPFILTAESATLSVPLVAMFGVQVGMDGLP
ncbi:MAG: hypothetical protein ACON3Z_18695 [Bradymonadia bacterium]